MGQYLLTKQTCLSHEILQVEAFSRNSSIQPVQREQMHICMAMAGLMRFVWDVFVISFLIIVVIVVIVCVKSPPQKHRLHRISHRPTLLLNFSCQLSNAIHENKTTTTKEPSKKNSHLSQRHSHQSHEVVFLVEAVGRAFLLPLCPGKSANG
jgi:hypothetical protein